MANREYQMLFKLGAQLGSNFNGTFSSAQQVLQKTQREIQNLNRQQGDISAYQKQQQSIEGTKEKLALYQKQLENVRKEMADSATYSSDLANKEEALKQRIKDTERTIADKTGKLQQMENALKDAGIDTDNLTQASLKLGEELVHLTRDEEKAAQEAAELGNKGSDAFEDIASALGSAGIVAGLKKVYDGFMDCVNISMEFGSTMSTVEALSGATSSEMAQLTQTAKDFGANTAFTANEAAQAMSYMGMAGWNAEQMMSGMDGVINLAASSGEDLANVSDIVTDNLTAFGLKAEDTAHFSDVLAAAATNSNTSVGIMGETFSGSAAIAGALGYSIEDVATAVGAMANAGVKGSVAGTALKNTFNGLLNGATLTSEAFGEVEYTAINADGTMKGFGDTVQELRGYFDQMTEAERVQNAMALAGQRGYNGLLAILNTSGEEYAALTDKITNCTGAAQRMSEIKLDNLKGDVTLLNSAADGLKATVGGMFNTEMRGLAKAGTAVLSGLNTFCEKSPVAVKSIMLVTGEVGGFLAVYKAVNAAKKIHNTLSALSTAAIAAETAATNAQTSAQLGLNAAMSASPIGLILGVAGAATVGITALVEHMRKAKEETDNSLIPSSQRQADKLKELQEEYDKIFDKTSDQALQLKYQIDETTDELEKNRQTVLEFHKATDELIAKNDETIQSFRDQTNETDNQSLSTLALIQHLKDLASQGDVTGTTGEKIKALYSQIKENMPDLQFGVEEVIKNPNLTVDAMKEQAKKLAEEKQYAFDQSTYADALLDNDKLKEEVQEAKDLYESFRYTNADGYTFYTDLDAAKEAKEKWEELQAQQEENEAVMREIEERWGSMAGAAEDGSDKEVNAYNSVSGALKEVSEQAEALMGSYNNAYQAAYESISGQYKLWDEAAEVSEMDVADINDSLSLQQEYWDNYNTNLDELIKKSDKISGLREMLSTVMDGSADSVNLAAGLVSDDVSDDDLAAMVENWQKVQEEQEKASGSLAELQTDFSDNLTKIGDKVENLVQKRMNLVDDAKDAASAMMKAYVDELLASKGSVESAADIVTKAAAAALNKGLYYYNPEDGSSTAKLQPDNIEGLQTISSGSITLPEATWRGSFGGYASGTYNALSGLALVGERGPELVNFNGGEQVLTAETTKALLSRSSGGSATVTVSPTINIYGNADEETARESAEQIVEMVIAALDERGIDARRGEYV